MSKKPETRELKFVLPLPPKEQSSNYRGHWGSKYGPVARYKEDTVVIALRVLGEGNANMIDHAQLGVTFFFPDKRVRDLDNYLTRLKPGIDGLVAARVIPKDDWLHVGRIILDGRLCRKRPRVEIIVRQIK